MPDTDPFSSADNGYAIVVAGNMNPSIHHPAWYKLIGALSDEELSSALTGLTSPAPAETPGSQEGEVFEVASDLIVTTPGLAQFTAGKMRIACVGQNWTITTYEQALLSRICNVASSVFEALTHTPVAAYGINFNFHRKTNVGDIGARLAQIVDATPLGLLKERDGTRSAKIGYTLSEAGRAFNVLIEPSMRGADVVFVGINAHHPIASSGGKFEQIDLTPLFQNSIEKDLVDAQDVLSRVIHFLGGNGAH